MDQQEEEEEEQQQQQRYDRARARVQAVKGFYVHASAYVLVNLALCSS